MEQMTAAPAPRILVVDDDRTNSRVIEALLTHEGLEAVVASSGAEALSLADAQLPDAVVLDLMMPGMDGYAVCELFKSSPRLRHIPVVFLSEVDDTDRRARGLDLGGVDFMLKSTPHREFIARLRRHALLGKALRSAILEREQFAAAGRLAQRELDEAAMVQRGALPSRWPEGLGYRFAARYEPCLRVGGDFFGAVTSATGEPVVYVLDVSGHGAAAAIVGGLAAYLLEQALKELPPAQALARLEKEFPATRYNRHFTAVCARLGKEGTLTYSKAGHPDPILIGRGGTRFLTAGGAPIGLGMGDEFPEGTVRLESGDRVLLYTDGLTETLDAGHHAFGARAAAEVLAEGRALPLSSALDRVLRRAVEHGGGAAAQDDVSAVLLEHI